MRKLSSCKKGQLSLLTPAIITLVVAAVILVIGLVILSSIQDTDVVTNGITVTVANESLTAVIDSAASPRVSRATSLNFNNFAVTGARNTTAGTNIPLSNVTVNASGTVFWNAGAGGNNGDNNTNWNVDYTYTRSDLSFEAANETIFGLGTFGDFWEIIILALIATIVIGLLLGGLGSLGRRR